MIVTITGPRSVGKSTISKLVAQKIKLRYVSSDEIGDAAMKEHGGLDKTIKSGLIDQFIKDSAYGLIRTEYEKEDFVFDLAGGAISSRKHPEANALVRETAKKKSIVIGLLPCENLEEAIEFLFEREKNRLHFKDMDAKTLMEKTVISYGKFPPLFKEFCNAVIYTKGKTPEQISDEIVINVNKIVKSTR